MQHCPTGSCVLSVRAPRHSRTRALANAEVTGAGTRRSPAGYGWRLRQAAGFGLVRTGLRLLDIGRA